MDFVLFKGRDFSEPFNFKNPTGKSIYISGDIKLILERGSWAREYTPGHGLSKTRTQVTWTIPSEESANFAYNTMYYTLYLNDTELVRGILRVQ